jgi:hypothetical protein
MELESLPFAIGQHTTQTPQLLTRVILNDIKRFSKVEKKLSIEKMKQYFSSLVSNSRC